MTDETKKVLCGKCQVPLNGPAEPEPESVFSCPSCGRGDTLENVHRIVGEFVRDETARYLQKGMKGAAGRSKFLKFTGKPIPEREYKFIVELDL
ncbi:hypothetical protein ACSHT0_08005 [Tepidicaulis sp. LMO-SS28]|uniref:hypothetical protein n=1 Tax=Tepidicaulis sp. LMO-SS28 TaxID=3447455 RepID=UPI003EDF0774